MLVWILVTGALFAGPPAPETANDVLLPCELPFLSPEPGQRYQIVATYQSWMGKTITLTGVEIPFFLENADVGRVVRTLPSRKTELLWTAEVHGAKPELEFHIVGAEPAPPFAELHEKVRQRSRRLENPDHRLEVCYWLLKSAAAAQTTELQGVAREELLAALTVCSRRPPTAGESFVWVTRGQEALGDDPRWGELIAGFGARRGEEPAVRSKLLESGFFLDRGGWRREEEFLAEIDMVRTEDGRLQTFEQHLLDQEIAEWGGSASDIDLLRRLTQKLYMEMAQQGLVEIGMKRDEVILARGYPSTVAWKRAGRQFYELWSYPDGWICFIDGKVFRWQ